jgi:hypothetical protein
MFQMKYKFNEWNTKASHLHTTSSICNAQENSQQEGKICVWTTYRQDHIRCRNWRSSTFMPYSVLEISSIRLELVPMVVLWHRKVWVYIVSESLCCLNLQAREQPCTILDTAASNNKCCTARQLDEIGSKRSLQIKSVLDSN